MHRGYIKLWRKLIDWEWFNDSNTLHLFIYLLLKANYKDGRYMGHLIKKGQCVFGRLKAAKSLNLSERNVRTSLNRLKSTSEVTIKTTNKFSVVTICNFETYNPENEEDDQQPDQQPDQQVTSNRPATDQQVTTSKEVKKEKKLKKKNIVSTPPSFEEFEKYCTENGYRNIAEKAFKYYSAADWHDSKENKVKNWKQKLIAVWFREENKDKSNNSESRYSEL